MQERNDIMSVDAMMDKRFGKVERLNARPSARRHTPIV